MGSKKFDVSADCFKYLGKYQSSEVMDEGYRCLNPIDLGLDPREMEYFKRNGGDETDENIDGGREKGEEE